MAIPPYQARQLVSMIAKYGPHLEYLVEAFWSDEDEGYIALVPDLPGCSAFGVTPEEAVHEIRTQRRPGSSCRAADEPVPEP